MKRILLAVSILLLLGCDAKVPLNSDLSESDANDIISELGHYDITADKQIDKTGVTLLVNQSDIDRSVRILNAAGLPHKARTNLGEMFQKNGIISSPLEERARYIYALSQELESTLSQIDGVVLARVSVVLPERVAPGEPVQPASASVFIKYTSELDPDAIRPRIHQLIAASIPGLSGKSDDAISIVFFPAVAYHDHINMVSVGPIHMRETTFNSVKVLLLVVLIMALLGGIGAAVWKQIKKRKQSGTDLAVTND
ncbi:EscJ/YscJ/HrcJ family type III secretion inner membrane ring protein [Pantoea sp. Al-1710]|uniref:Lipoprotein n=1 Tax=Candidatus Pantoea communis TaxID=2608354 RepID=A0ABX0RI98_9GAMM|nr:MULTISPECIES: type III secretion inner membrane ring lipoprotein SctJ [Pantoea]NIG12953.1 EscJ/YscJ/HrcJ family type III secretion inner membrane ring protein [Pantoea sp. Cy-640]NIG17346.1 EscJ/YscJ/HrcJ family type III secretion inner membrane ring protein [Pantoea communis]